LALEARDGIARDDGGVAGWFWWRWRAGKGR
jgi:hypothetical protein